uniref:FAM86 N-terminal domain-containing protein n=1 Tax=Rousettus aegyptiacus TaxID=9407 RepID=A0A7J8EYB6_ROUAE|nr:hypothetical protein HJG63_004933 [Rousettus aegyptiacus]
MAREENVNSARLLRSFERRFLATRGLRSFPWQSLEEKLRDSGSELLLDILQKTVKHPLCVKHPPSVKYVRCFLSELIRKMCCIAQKPSSPWSGSCRGSLLARRTSGLPMPMLPSPSATQRRARCSPPSWAGLGSHGKLCLATTRNCFPMKSTQRLRF